MPLPTVWPEHPESLGVIGYHDCTQSAALMCLVYAGKTDYPLGIYTVAERNALDAADDRPDNTGATLDGSLPGVGWLDKQVANRYGVTMRRLPDDSEATLRKYLTTPGYALLLQGSMGNLPVGHPLRRWQPEFGGGHAVCVISGTQPRWLDPLGPKGFAGDLTDADTILRFAWDGAKYSRYLKKDELAGAGRTDTGDDTRPQTPDTATTEEPMVYVREVSYSAPRLIRCLAGGMIRAYQPPSHDVVKTLTLTRPSSFHAEGEAFVTGWSEDPKNPVYEYWVAADGVFEGLLVAKSSLTVAAALPTAPSQADYTAAINAAVEAAKKPFVDALTLANGRLTDLHNRAVPVSIPK
jgi:hypothetical protein